MTPKLIPYPVLLMLTFTISGCVSLYPHSRFQESQFRFSPAVVWHQCAQLGCREPNTIVASYFADIAAQAGASCIIHILPPGGEALVWNFWNDYLAPSRRFLGDHQIRLYAYASHSTASYRQAQMQLNAIRRLYLDDYAYYRPFRQYAPLHVTQRAETVLPPYRAPPCQGRPVMELASGARLVSEFASPAAEHIDSEERAARTVLVVVD